MPLLSSVLDVDLALGVLLDHRGVGQGQPGGALGVPDVVERGEPGVLLGEGDHDQVAHGALLGGIGTVRSDGTEYRSRRWPGYPCPMAQPGAIPERFRAFVAEKLDDGVVRGVRELATTDLPDGEVDVRVAWSSVNYKDALAASPTGKVARI